MTYCTLSETQIFSSITGSHIESKISKAILEADKAAKNNQSVITVVELNDNSIQIFNEFKMLVASKEIKRTIYETSAGFTFDIAA